MLEQGEIVLIPVPFTDLSAQKRRPVIVVSNDAYNATHQDIIVVALTSNPLQIDYSLLIESTDLEKGDLHRPSRIRVDKIYTLSQAIVVQKFGKVTPKVLEKIRFTLETLLANRSAATKLTPG